MWWKLVLALPIVLSMTLGGSGVIQNQTQYIASASDNKSRIAQRVSSATLIEPASLYSRVWQLIKEDFYDDKYNGQDWARWEHKYDKKLKTLDDAHKAVETMLASLGDRYTRFLDRDAFDDEKQQIDARLYGIGIQIGIDSKTNKIVVIAPIDDTPASRAGIMAGDEIFEINGKSTKGFSVEDAAKQIRGQINTQVILILVRNSKKVKMTVVRAEIPIKAVQTSKMLDTETGYIRLSSFISQQASKEMKDALGKLSTAKGIILDLRGNPGGLLTNAIDISNMFLDSGNIVSTVDRDGYKTPAQSDGKPLCRVPLVVLIDKGSASASEITSGALKDNGRAVLVGAKTFGKGLVQGINRLEDGSGVNITIAKYLTPNDTDINKKGINPDVVVELNQKELEDEKLPWRGPWWLDRDNKVKRQPEDLKDLQLKAALDEIHKKITEASKSTSPVASKLN